MLVTMDAIRVKDQVLNTYELLESILLHLLPKDLRQARCVCQTWRDLIARSEGLKKTSQTRQRHFTLALLGEQGAGKRSLAESVSLHLPAQIHI
jgi:pantothenate kinase-related protein Tda10